MAHALALRPSLAFPAADWLRMLIVLGCALTLIMAGKALPF
jgi:hypothetical protein